MSPTTTIRGPTSMTDAGACACTRPRGLRGGGPLPPTPLASGGAGCVQGLYALQIDQPPATLALGPKGHVTCGAKHRM